MEITHHLEIQNCHPEGFEGLSFNGACYWWACNENEFITLLFDLSDEIFRMTPMPSTINDK